MRIVRRTRDAQAWSSCYRTAGLSLGFVPMLGGLHQGHRALLETARRECDRVAASIYLNPTQFDSPRDLETYPLDAERDVEVCSEAGVDLLYLGSRSELLPEDFQSWVEVERLTRPLCGAFRPGHFRGVTTVVAQLLHAVVPHRLYMGQKDYQQARAIRRMVDDLRWAVEVRRVPIVREADGLAMSSRNARLSAVERAAAPAIHEALEAGREAILGGERRAGEIAGRLRHEIERRAPLRVEYAEVVDADSLEAFPGGEIDAAAPAGILVAVAVHAGETRLIDNVVIEARDVAGASRPGPSRQ